MDLLLETESGREEPIGHEDIAATILLFDDGMDKFVGNQKDTVAFLLSQLGSIENIDDDRLDKFVDHVAVELKYQGEL